MNGKADSRTKCRMAWWVWLGARGWSWEFCITWRELVLRNLILQKKYIHIFQSYLWFSCFNDSAVIPFSFWVSRGRLRWKSVLRHPAHFNVLSGSLLGNVWGSGWRRWWWLRKIDLLSVPFSPKSLFFIPVSRCFSIIFLWQMDKWWLRSPEG